MGFRKSKINTFSSNTHSHWPLNANRFLCFEFALAVEIFRVLAVFLGVLRTADWLGLSGAGRTELGWKSSFLSARCCHTILRQMPQVCFVRVEILEKTKVV